MKEFKSLHAVVLVQLKRSATSASMANSERTQSDVESDEEFEEMTSDELCRFYFGDFVLDVVCQALDIQLRKKRLDRVEKILEVLFADPSRFSSKFQDLDTTLWEAFTHMPIGELPEFLVADNLPVMLAGTDFRFAAA